MKRSLELKYLISMLLLMCGSVGVFSQNPINEDYRSMDEGSHKETRSDGSIRCQYVITNGNLNGPRDCYYRNGKLWIHEIFDAGKYNGLNFSLNENGDTIFIERYQNDTLFYTRNFQYYKNGNFKLVSTIHYVNDSTLIGNPFKTRKGLGRRSIDIRHTEMTVNNKGWVVQFFKNGSISDSMEITNGKYTGTNIKLYKSGKKMIDSRLKNSKYHGNYIEYYESGQIKIETSYSENKIDGKYIEYAESGEIIEESTYQLGKKIK